MIRSLVASVTRLITGVGRLPCAPCGGEAAIYFANHTSHLDFAVVWAAAGTPHCVFPITPGELLRVSGGTALQVNT